MNDKICKLIKVIELFLIILSIIIYKDNKLVLLFIENKKYLLGEICKLYNRCMKYKEGKYKITNFNQIKDRYKLKRN